MKTLVAFSLLVAAVMAEPQYVYSGVPTSYYGGVYPYSGVYNPAVVASPYVSPVVSPVVGSPAVIAKTYVPTVTYPVQDTSRGLPQAVQDTPEVKAAKSAFAAEYAQTVARNAGAVSVPVQHSIQKRAAPVVPVQTPASTVYTGSYVASPYVASPYVASPYVSTYTGGYSYGAYPYARYPYVY